MKTCGACGAATGVAQRFCGECGAVLAELPTERRQITILFCDLVGSTELSGKLDPEDLRSLIAAYQDAAGQVISRTGGHVAQYLGDGLLVYYGYPTANEDDAVRSVKAALGIVKAIAEIAPAIRRDFAADLEVRIGVHTGEGVVGALGHAGRREQLVIGQAPNVAARLQGCARPGQVVISAEVLALVRSSFVVHPLGAQRFKGVNEPVLVYEVTGERVAQSRFEASLQRELSPLVARQAEIETLLAAFERAARGAGQLAMVTGEAGIGKSRLVHDLHERLGEERCSWLVCQCSQLAQGSAFGPIVELLARRMDWKSGDSTGVRVGKLQALAERCGLDRDSAVAILGSFLGLDVAAEVAALGLVSEAIRSRFMATVVKVVGALAAEGPLVLAIEDLHWADPSSLELLGELARSLPSVPVLAVMTLRPERPNPWPAMTTAAIHLERLAGADAGALAGSIAGASALSRELLDELVARSDGVPLYIEELTKFVIEAGPGSRQEAIPTSLRASLVARLDHLGPAKETAQIAAAIGRQFEVRLLADVVPDATVLRDRLERLERAELILPASDPRAREVYTFKHALVQDAACAMMVRERRREVHGRIADAMARPEHDAGPEPLAHHLERAERPREALSALQRAAMLAVSRSGHAEAIAFHERSLAQLAKLPDTAENKHLEIDLRAALGASLVVTRGYGHPDLDPNYTRARELCTALGDPPALLSVLYGLWVFHLSASDRAQAHRYMEEIRAFVPESDEPARIVVRSLVHGIMLFYGGHYGEAVTHLRRVNESLWTLDMHEHLTRHYLDDSGMWAYSWRVWIHAFRGELAVARSCVADLLTLSQKVEDPRSIAKGHCYEMAYHHEARRPEEMLAAADRLIALAGQQSLPYWLCHGLIGRGLALLCLGQASPEEGLAILDGGLQIYALTGLKLPISYWTLYRVEALVLLGKLDEALELVERLIAGSATALEANMRPEELRLKAEILRRQGRTGAALPLFEEAAAIAREQGAHIHELRALCGAVALHRAAEREPAVAVDRLRELLGASPEAQGFPDHLDAEALLASAAE